MDTFRSGLNDPGICSASLRGISSPNATYSIWCCMFGFGGISLEEWVAKWKFPGTYKQHMNQCVTYKQHMNQCVTYKQHMNQCVTYKQYMDQFVTQVWGSSFPSSAIWNDFLNFLRGQIGKFMQFLTVILQWPWSFRGSAEYNSTIPWSFQVHYLTWKAFVLYATFPGGTTVAALPF